MQHLPIARSLRLALMGLTLGLALIAAIGVSSLYRARQRDEDRVAQSAALATAAANLLAAGISNAAVTAELHGPATGALRAGASADFAAAAATARRLATGDPASATLVARQIAALRSGSGQATGGPGAVAAIARPLLEARGLDAAIQARASARQRTARATAGHDADVALALVIGAGILALLAAIGSIGGLVGKRQRLAETIESLGDALLVTDGSGRIDAVNPRAGELVPELPAGADPAADTSPLPPLETALAHEVEVEHHGRALAVTASRLGAGGGVVWTVRDVSERARLERAKSDFVAMASHELRSPLTSIKGFVELLHHSADNMTDRQREFVDIILRSTDRLAELVGDLLDVARIEADRVDIDRRPIDVGEAVRDVVELMGPRLAAKHQQLGVYIAPTLPLAHADPTRVRQIVANLLTNAHLYTPPEGRIHIGVEGERAWVQIVVADSGVGLTEEERQRVFERFYRAAGAREAAGTGLGLSIVRSLVEMHDGEIDVASLPGRGSTFRVRLPAAAPLPGNVRALDVVRGRRVLVIDDEREVAELIAGQLAPLDVRAEIATDSARALEQLRRTRYDAVTLDILMPGRDGLSLLDEIRRDPALRGLPVVFVSVQAERPALAGEWRVAKPIDADELREVLIAAISSGRSRVLVVARESLQPRLEPALDDLGIEHEWQTSGPAAARVCAERRFEVALIDVGIRRPQAVLEALDLRGRRLRRTVVLFSDGEPPLASSAHRLGMEVVPADQAAGAVLAALRGERAD